MGVFIFEQGSNESQNLTPSYYGCSALSPPSRGQFHENEGDKSAYKARSEQGMVIASSKCRA